MAQQAAVETIGSWTEEQLKQTISEMVKESVSVVRPKRDFYEEFEDSTAGRIVRIEADLQSLKELTVRGFAEQEKRFLAEIGSLRTEMQGAIGTLRAEIRGEIAGLERWIKTSFAILIPITLAVLGVLIKLAIK